jgi:hypothetical protein
MAKKLATQRGLKPCIGYLNALFVVSDALYFYCKLFFSGLELRNYLFFWDGFASGCNEISELFVYISVTLVISAAGDLDSNSNHLTYSHQAEPSTNHMYTEFKIIKVVN